VPSPSNSRLRSPTTWMRPARSDDLADAIDYGEVTRRAALVVAEQRFALLEALGDAVGRAVLEDGRIHLVTVRLHKLRPPCTRRGIDWDCASTLAADERVRVLNARCARARSNLGDRWSLLAAGVAALRELDPGAIVSSVYETAPVGGPEGPGCVLELCCGARDDARTTAVGSRSRGSRLGPIASGPSGSVRSTLDVDVLVYGDEQSDDERRSRFPPTRGDYFEI